MTIEEISVISKRLKWARKRAGLTQLKLGVLADIDEYTASARMSQYESGVHEPDLGTMIRLADVLQIPVSYMYEPNEPLAEIILLMAGLSEPQLISLRTIMSNIVVHL